MIEIDVPRLIENIPERTTVYTPLIEAIVNSIHSIEDSGRDDGQILVRLIRSPQKQLDISSLELPEIIGFVIEDNGIGFTEENFRSFKTLYSAHKQSKGGKGFGRFIFLKYFKNINISSTFKHENSFYTRDFKFHKDNQPVLNEQYKPSDSLDSKTTIYLNDLNKGKYEKKLETIAKKIIQHLLIYFINDSYKCPDIYFLDEYEGKKENIKLNDYLKQQKYIQEIKSDTFVLESNKDNLEEIFNVKILKIFFPDKQKNSLILTAHNREVTTINTENYISEFSKS